MTEPPRDADRVIRGWRQRAGLTQEGLARALGVTFSTVNRWENGHVRPSRLAWKSLTRLVTALGGSPLTDAVTDGEHPAPATAGDPPPVGTEGKASFGGAVETPS